MWLFKVCMKHKWSRPCDQCCRNEVLFEKKQLKWNVFLQSLYVVFFQLATVHSLLAADPLLVHCCDEDGYTPLHRAAYSGHIEVVCALLAGGSKVNPRTIDGWTPLHSACRWSRVSVASFLLQHGAELNAQTNGGLTPLHLAASYTSFSKTDSRHTLELLLSQRHLKPGLRSSSGETAGEVARRSGPHHFMFEMVEDYVNVVPISWTKAQAHAGFHISIDVLLMVRFPFEAT